MKRKLVIHIKKSTTLLRIWFVAPVLQVVNYFVLTQPSAGLVSSVGRALSYRKVVVPIKFDPRTRMNVSSNAKTSF